MDPATTLVATSATITAAQNIKSALSDTLEKVRSGIDNGADEKSLASYVKKSIVEAPCFIQESIVEESAINDIIKNLFNIYIGYIVCALQMDQHLIDGRRVRDVLAPVSTTGAFESLEDEFINTNDLTMKFVGSMEAITTTTSTSSSHGPKGVQTTSTKTVTESEDKADPENKYNSDKNTWNASTGFRYDRDKQFNMSIAAGRTIDLTLSTGIDSPPITVPVVVVFNSRIIPNTVFEYIFGRDFQLPFVQRWLQYRSGEIRFFKDLVFNIDRLDRRAKALKHDESGALSVILRHQNKAKLKKAAQIGDKDKSHNLANAILITDEETVKTMAKKSGYNLDRYLDRQWFFNTIYALFIVLVDSRYSRVTIYTNGIEHSATYSYNELKSSASSDKLSLKEVVEYLTKSQMPRF